MTVVAGSELAVTGEGCQAGAAVVVVLTSGCGRRSGGTVVVVLAVAREREKNGDGLSCFVCFISMYVRLIVSRFDIYGRLVKGFWLNFA